MAIPPSIRRAVVARAEGRCEYCQLSQTGQEATFHVDHIVPFVAGGSTELANLALACVSCSLHKAAKQHFVDPETTELADIFDPRKDIWADHFAWQGPVLTARTAKGRATVEGLKLNRELIVSIRREEMVLQRHPPT